MRTAIITAVWGEHFIEFFASQIYPGIASRMPSDWILVIGTPRQGCDSVFRMADRASVKVLAVDAPASLPKHALNVSIAKECMRHAADTYGIRRYLFQNADMYVSDSAYRLVDETAARVVTTPGIRIFLEEHFATYFSIAGLDEKEVLRRALTTLHPNTKSLAIAGGYVFHNNTWPSVLYSIGDGFVHCAAFHRHPLLVDLPDGFDLSQDFGTVDDRLMEVACSDPAEYRHLRHSDEGFVLEYSRFDHYLESLASQGLDQRFDEESVVAWSRSSACSDLHRKLASMPYTWATRGDIPANPFVGFQS